MHHFKPAGKDDGFKIIGFDNMVPCRVDNVTGVSGATVSSGSDDDSIRLTSTAIDNASLVTGDAGNDTTWLMNTSVGDDSHADRVLGGAGSDRIVLRGTTSVGAGSTVDAGDDNDK